jgi:hypothetical protein
VWERALTPDHLLAVGNVLVEEAQKGAVVVQQAEAVAQRVPHRIQPEEVLVVAGGLPHLGQQQVQRKEPDAEEAV